MVWYQAALGMTETVRLADATGKVMHAELKLGDATIMLADEFPDMGYRAPDSLGGSPVSILLYVEDVDALFNRALANGAAARSPLAVQFDGDRRGTLLDPFGHIWLLATKTEHIPPDELRRRFVEMLKAPA
jgi:PhnB protein